MTDAIGWHSSIARDFDAKYTSTPAFRERLRVWDDVIARYMDAQSHVLDAGCGSGVLAALAAPRAQSVLGFDASEPMIALANTRRREAQLANTTFRVAALEDPDLLRGRQFDFIMCSSVLEYIDDYWRVFDWFASSLQPAGVIAFSMPNGASLYRKFERLAFGLIGRPAYYAHVRHVPLLEEVRTGIAARKFEIVASQYYAAVPMLSPFARAAGRADLADNLFVVVCRRIP